MASDAELPRLLVVDDGGGSGFRIFLAIQAQLLNKQYQT